MKKSIIILILVLFCLSGVVSATEDEVYSLACIIAGEMGDEPFVVRVAYGEMLINSGSMVGKRRNTPNRSDIRAAAASMCNCGFSGGATNVKLWKKVENTPLEMRSGVRLYDWFFYI